MKTTKQKIIALFAFALMMSLSACTPASLSQMKGEANDGVDFSALVGSNIYYGAYRHAESLDGGLYNLRQQVFYDTVAQPMLWQVMGEENGDGNLTLFSKYVLDQYYFYHDGENPNNMWADSDLIQWLNDPDYDGVTLNGDDVINKVTGRGFLSSEKNPFTTAEISDELVPRVTVLTYTYDNLGNHVKTYDSTAYSQKLYLPWGKMDDGTVYWDAANIPGNDYQIADLTTTLRNGKDSPNSFWLRSPLFEKVNYAMAADEYDPIFFHRVEYGLGIRPIFKVNKECIIFASEAGGVGEDTGYSAQTDEVKNYKLTILNSGIFGGSMTVNGKTFDGDAAHPTIKAKGGGSVSIAAAGAASTTYLTYKIVSGDENRSLVAYGQGGDNASLTVKLQNSADENLEKGVYIVYVWAQINQMKNSNEGSAPQYFILQVT